MSVNAAQLKEFLQREDVPADAKAKAVELWDKAHKRLAEPAVAGVTPTTTSTTTTTTPTTSTPTTTQPTPGASELDLGGSAHASSGEAEIAEGVQDAQGSWTPTIARTAGPIVGGIVGSAIPVVGTAAGAAIGAGVGDWIAQESEVDSGLRQAYNPLRTGGEIITAGYFSKFQAGKTLMQAAAKGALGNMGSDTFINLTEGKGLPNTFELAVSGLTGGILSGVGQKAPEMWQARKAAAKEISGSDEVAERVADFMGPRATGQQLELPGSRLGGGSILDQQPEQLGFPDVTKTVPGVRKGAKPKQVTEAFGGEPTPLFGPPGSLKTGAKKRAGLKQFWTDEQLKDQFGFDDIEEGRTFEKLMHEDNSPDNYTLNLGDSGPETKGWKIAQITQSEQDTWARLKGKAQGKREMLETPMDRDQAMGDVSAITNAQRGNPSASRAATTKGVKSVGRPKDVFKRMEVDHDYPVYQDYHDSSQAYRRAQTDVSKDSAVATKAIANTSKAERTSIFQAFMAGGDFSRLPRRLQSKAADLWGMADKQLQEYGLTASDYFGKYLPQVQSGKTMKEIIEEGSSPAAIPKRLQFTEDVADGILSPLDPSIVGVMDKLIEVGAYRRHVADAATELKLGKYGPKGDAPAEIKVEMNKYLNTLKGTTGDPSAETTDNIFGMISGKLGLKMSGTELANGLIRSTYTGLMGLRPSSIIRNAMQTIQTGVPVYGPKSFAVGLKRAFTEEGMAVARAAGVIDEGNMLREFAEGVKPKKTGGVLAPVRFLKEHAFTPFQYMEEKNRAISYLAGIDKFDSALKASQKVGGGRSTWKTLMDKADIDMLSEPEIEVLAKMWDAGESMDKIRHIYAQGIVDDTQFMYLRPERARILQTQAGRTLGGFANWGQGYASYIARMTGQGPPRKRTRQIIRFGVSNAAIVAAFMGAGGVMGDEDTFGDAMGWTFAGPLFYGGGPILTTAQSMVNNIRKGVQGQESAGAFATQMATDISTFVPFGGVGRDIVRASKEATPKEAMGRFLGFKRGKS